MTAWGMILAARRPAEPKKTIVDLSKETTEAYCARIEGLRIGEAWATVIAREPKANESAECGAIRLTAYRRTISPFGIVVMLQQLQRVDGEFDDRLDWEPLYRWSSRMEHTMAYELRGSVSRAFDLVEELLTFAEEEAQIDNWVRLPWREL